MIYGSAARLWLLQEFFDAAVRLEELIAGLAAFVNWDPYQLPIFCELHSFDAELCLQALGHRVESNNECFLPRDYLTLDQLFHIAYTLHAGEAAGDLGSPSGHCYVDREDAIGSRVYLPLLPGEADNRVTEKCYHQWEYLSRATSELPRMMKETASRCAEIGQETVALNVVSRRGAFDYFVVRCLDVSMHHGPPMVESMDACCSSGASCRTVDALGWAYERKIHLGSSELPSMFFLYPVCEIQGAECTYGEDKFNADLLALVDTMIDAYHSEVTGRSPSLD